jgi:hypothetical protein
MSRMKMKGHRYSETRKFPEEDRVLKKEQERSGSKVIDKTLDMPAHTVDYLFGIYERYIAMYAITHLIRTYKPRLLANSAESISHAPSTLTIETDRDELTVVYNNVLAVFDQGVIEAQYLPEPRLYQVVIGSGNKEDLDFLVDAFANAQERSNFFQGKCLKFNPIGFDFIAPPEATFEDVVLPEAMLREYRMNTIEFLQNQHMQRVTKKRGVILSGKPGVGKTTLISATFNELQKQGITCIFFAGDCLGRMPISQVFSFIIKYLTPCALAMEDFDLIAPSRADRGSRFIGEILSFLNGIESVEKPLVVIGTTNRFEVLDEAATRPCRFDRHWVIEVPNKETITMLWAKMMPGVPVDGILEKAEAQKVTGAHIKEIANTTLMLHAATGEPMEKCAARAVDEVCKSFLIISPKRSMGFAPEYEEEEEDDSRPIDADIPEDAREGDEWEMDESGKLIRR